MLVIARAAHVVRGAVDRARAVRAGAVVVAHGLLRLDLIDALVVRGSTRADHARLGARDVLVVTDEVVVAAVALLVALCGAVGLTDWGRLHHSAAGIPIQPSYVQRVSASA